MFKALLKIKFSISLIFYLFIINELLVHINIKFIKGLNLFTGYNIKVSL
jgi:hypothetical protein